jgi:ABC-type polysaccharide/polyol phosphate transport system ATPase subunit
MPGDSLGIIGPNGAGKTTILKLLSKVTYPTSGEIIVNGKFSALIELGAGFHPDLTGRDNIYLNGTILGMKKAEIKSRFDQIVEFAGIEEYLDTPVKRYSSGMYARLGFAVAAHVDPEILLVDEVLAVGDMAFRKKCYDRMLSLQQHGTTILFISHNFNDIQRVCSRCLVMYRGDLAFDGPTSEATARYSNILREAAAKASRLDLPEMGALKQRVMSHEAVIEDVRLLREDDQPSYVFNSGDIARVRMKVKFHKDIQAPVFACTIRTEDGQIVYDFTTHWANIQSQEFKKDSLIEIEYRLNVNLTGGTYHLGVDLATQDLSYYYDRLERALDFVVTGGNGARGVADLQAKFEVLGTDVGELQPSQADI